MSALPFVFSLLAAVLLAPGLLATLGTRENYRGVAVAFPFGMLVLFAAVVALVPVAALDQATGGDLLRPDVGLVCLYALGVGVLGLADDVLGGGDARGWRGHGAQLRGGALSTGALKAVGAVGLALLVLRGRPDYLLGVVVLVLATNAFNLLDLRPGRSIKAFVALGTGLTIGAWDTGPLATLGLFVAPVLVAGFFDLTVRAMLGDTASNVVGALAGLWLVLTLSTTGLAIAAALLALLTAYGEFRSISGFIDRTPVLRHLDSIGRPHV